MSQLNAHACMKAFIWRTVITEMKRSVIEVLPEGYRVGVSLLDCYCPVIIYYCKVTKYLYKLSKKC